MQNMQGASQQMYGRQASGRATLKPQFRKANWVARGVVPIRLLDGTVGSRRVERGFGPDCTTGREREAKCAEWNFEYEERFRNPRKLITFAQAYITYLNLMHPVPLYGEKILHVLGTKDCSEIDDTLIGEVCKHIFPKRDAKASTLNRHIFTPVLAILRVALKEKAPMLQRPKGHDDVTPVEIPPNDWYARLVPHLNPNQRAFMMFLAMHGRRTAEALGRTPADLRGHVLDLGRTKTGALRQVLVEPACLKLIHEMPDWQKRKWLFGAGPNSANSFRRDLKKACRRAGIDWYHPHAFGRHMSVTRMLLAGYSTKYVADAHGMTEEMVANRYGHLSQRESTAALHLVGRDLYDLVFGAEPRPMLPAPNGLPPHKQ